MPNNGNIKTLKLRQARLRKEEGRAWGCYINKHYATETNTKEQQVSDARSDATQEAGIRKDVNQSQSETDTQRVELLNPKTKIRVGSWNVRTLYQAGKLWQVLQEMESYNTELLCVSEVRWIYSGKRTLSTRHTILYSGQTDHQHSGGDSIIVTRELITPLLD